MSATLKRSSLWRGVTTFRLTQNMRLRRPGLYEQERAEVARFAAELLDIGEAVGADADRKVQ